MKRKLILILLAAALLCGAFAVVALAADDNPTDAAKPDEKKKLSEFTDEEFEEFFKGRELTQMSAVGYTVSYKDDPKQFWQWIRDRIADFENDINQMFHFGYWENYIYSEELRAVVSAYYGIECKPSAGPMHDDYFYSMYEKFRDVTE